MDESNIFKKPLNRRIIPKSASINNDHLQNDETPQSVGAKSNKDNPIDYKNISFTLTGEISSSSIHRNNLTQKHQSNVLLVEDNDDDDEQFISNIKQIIDKNHKIQNKENHNLRETLQTESYLSKKKKCIFSDEDQHLIKRFKKSVDENRVLRATLQKPQQTKSAAPVSNFNCPIMTSTPNITSVITFNKVDIDFSKCNTNQFFSHINLQQNNQLIMPKPRGNVRETEIVETEVEQLYCYEIPFLTPPKEGNNLSL